MKKNKKLLIILAIIIIPAVFWKLVYNTGKNISTLFKTENINEIQKIIIRNGSKDSLLLEKKDTTWYVNRAVEARQESILLLLESIESGEIQSLVSEKNTEKEKEFLKKINKNISVYSKSGRIKTLFCGRYDSVLRASCLRSSESEKLYFVSVPGIAEDYSKIFRTEIIYWITPEIFHYQPKEIKEITVEYPSLPQKSFQIRISENKFQLFTYPELKSIPNINQELIADYLTKFADVKFNYIFTNLNSKTRDSLLMLQPEYIIKVINKNNVENVLKTFLRKKGKTGQIDPDILNAAIQSDKQIVTVKFYDLDLILRNRDYFIKH
jgi:hypothetical protein